MRLLAVVAGLGQASAQIPCPSTSSCCFQTPTATYELSSLNSETGVIIKDWRNDTDSANWAYYFSLCGDMDPPGNTVTPNTMCNRTSSGSGPGAAFQVGVNFPACYRLGDHALPPAPSGYPTQFYANVYNPAHGFSVQYSNGDSCLLPNGTTVSRSLVINLRCANMRGLNPGAWFDEVTEDTTCTYYASVFDFHACPLQCPRTPPTYRLCGGFGVCDYDASAEQARCFCNQGYSGSDCSQIGSAGAPPAPSYGGNIAGGFFGGLFGGLALVLGYFGYKSWSQKTPFLDSIRIGGGAPGATRLPSHDNGAGASWTGASAGNDVGSVYAAAGGNGGYVAPDLNAGVGGGDGPLLG